MVNWLKIVFGKIVIGLFYYPWRIAEKLLKRDLGAGDKAHYYIMMLFRRLFRSFLVTIKYRNQVAKNPLDLRLNVDLCQNNQQWYFRLKGDYEIGWMKVIASAMEANDTFVDIGANVGVYAITIAQAFPDKKILAIEPLEANFELLCRNIELNSFVNVRTLKAAVSNDERPTVQFYPNPIHDGGGSIIQRETYRTGEVLIDAERYREKNPLFSSTVEVANVKLDSLIDSKSVIKIDVEGAEVTVLESGKAALTSGLIDLLVVEVLVETIDDVISLLDELGFDCFSEKSEASLRSGNRLDHFVGNLVVLRRASPDYSRLKETFRSIITDGQR